MIYFLRSVNIDGDRFGAIKIGCSKQVNSRISQLKVAHGDLQLLGIMPGEREQEAELHKRFSEYLIPDHGREWFTPDESIMDIIAKSANVIPDFSVPLTPVERKFHRFQFLMLRLDREMENYHKRHFKHVRVTNIEIMKSLPIKATTLSHYLRGFVTYAKPQTVIELADYFEHDRLMLLYPSRFITLNECRNFAAGKDVWPSWRDRAKVGDIPIAKTALKTLSTSEGIA